MADVFDLGFPQHAPSLSSLQSATMEAGTVLDNLHGAALYAPVQELIQAGDHYARLSRQALKKPLKAVSAGIDHATELAGRALAPISEELQRIKLEAQGISPPRPTQPPSSIPLGGPFLPPPPPSPPVLPPTPPTPGCGPFTVLAYARCCTGGLEPGPHIGISPYGYAQGVPPDLANYPTEYRVDSNGNMLDDNGNVIATGCGDQFAACTWDELRAWIKKCVPSGGQPLPTDTCPAGQGIDPNTGQCTTPPPPPTPAPAATCVTSADIGWSMDTCSDQDIQDAETNLGVDFSQMWDGSSGMDWWNTQFGAFQGITYARPGQTTFGELP